MKYLSTQRRPGKEGNKPAMDKNLDGSTAGFKQNISRRRAKVS
jgi:hypothetical protein